MAPDRLAAKNSHLLNWRHQPNVGHVSKTNHRALRPHMALDMVCLGPASPNVMGVGEAGPPLVPLSPSPPPPPSPIRVLPPATPIPAPSAAIFSPQSASAWHEALRAADFELEHVGWQPTEFLACAVSLLGAGAQCEAESDFVSAGQHYIAGKVVAQYAMSHMFSEGSDFHRACADIRAVAGVALERCTVALQGPAPTALAPEPDASGLLANMPEPVKILVKREMGRLQGALPDPEGQMSRRYVDWCLALPWKCPHPVTIDVEEARRILDEEHQGLNKVKARILEEVAVQKRLGGPTGSVLCLVGPPGVGKTSVVRSIARALGKTLLRQALGGVSDEMEIRGNNRAYTGAQPGRIVQEMCRAGYSDPVFQLDEIDKIVRQTNRGDPSAALLELLDPEQNHAFKDAYLGFGYDLSQVTFIATANYVDDIPAPLRDRLEIITLSGYTPLEKRSIGREHLIPKQMLKNRLNQTHLSISDAGLAHLIKHYTREPGVRQLEQQIAGICRKVVTRLEGGQSTGVVAVEPDTIIELLGPQRYRGTTRMQQTLPGVVNGLAWTQAGGAMLPVEAKAHPRRDAEKGGNLVLTGNVRKVMEESASIALNFLRTSFPALNERIRTRDLYIHLPAAAVKKDGPSAGVTLVTALTAALIGHLVPDDTAMTGEVGLFGEIWPVGGIQEKSIAAYDAGCKRLFLPKANASDLEDIPAEVKENVEIVLVEHCSELLQAIFGTIPALKPVILSHGLC